MDTLGLILKVVVTAGNVQDHDGTKTLLEEIAPYDEVIKRLKLIWTDGGHRGELITWVEDTFGWKLEIVEKSRPKWFPGSSQTLDRGAYFRLVSSSTQTRQRL